MFKLFSLIFDWIIWVASFSTNLARWASSFAKFGTFQVAIRAMLFYAFYAFVLLIIVTSVAFVYYMFTSIIKIYNMISALLVLISQSSTSGDDIVSAVYYFLNVTGVVAGFQAFFPFLASAVLFILIKSLYKTTLYLYVQVLLPIAGFVMKVP